MGYVDCYILSILLFYIIGYFIKGSKLTGQFAECHVGKPHAGGVKLHRGIQLLTTPGHAS